MAESNGKRILVGIGLNPFFRTSDTGHSPLTEETWSLLRAAKALAVRSAASLHVVHVLEENTLGLSTLLPWLPTINWRSVQPESMVHLARKEAATSCQNQLAAITQSLKADGLQITSKVVTAKYASTGILAEAIAVNGSMIMVSSGFRAEHYFSRGFSTPLAIMAEALVPVLVVGSDCKIDFSRERLRLLMADDLRDESKESMASALEWAKSLGKADVFHLHVEELTGDQLHKLLTETAHRLKSSADPVELSSELLKALETALQEKMQQRVKGRTEQLLSAGGTFQSAMRRCPFIKDEIERAADEFGADLLVFGRHQKVHQRPYQVGKVTFQAMLSPDRGVLVFPR